MNHVIKSLCLNRCYIRFLFTILRLFRKYNFHRRKPVVTPLPASMFSWWLILTSASRLKNRAGFTKRNCFIPSSTFLDKVSYCFIFATCRIIVYVMLQIQFPTYSRPRLLSSCLNSAALGSWGFFFLNHVNCFPKFGFLSITIVLIHWLNPEIFLAHKKSRTTKKKKYDNFRCLHFSSSALYFLFNM